MFKYLLIHHKEIALKGGNRSFFEKKLVDNIRIALGRSNYKKIERLDGRILIFFEDEVRDEVIEKIKRIFGIAYFSRVMSIEPEIEKIVDAAVKLATAKKFSTFAVRTKRADKKFKLTSEEVNKIIGKEILEKIGGGVDLKNPEITLSIEITSSAAFLSAEKINGPGGLPSCISGKVVALLSGGIDSPVAAYKVMKRGAEVIFLHFHSYPHTNKASMEKVKRLVNVLGGYQPKTTLCFVPLGDAQREIVMSAEPKYRVLLYRRLMMRVAERLAKQENAKAIMTGESLGQVASQTLPNLAVVEEAVHIPVLRPLIGDDKDEIIDLAKRIGTFEISIEPHDDCCSLFSPKNPATGARIDDILKEEEKLSVQKLVEDMLERIEKIVV